MNNMKSLVLNRSEKSELLFAVIGLTSNILNIEIDNISEDWCANEEDESHEYFREIFSYIVHKDYVSEETLQEMKIYDSSDLISFYSTYAYENNI